MYFYTCKIIDVRNDFMTKNNTFLQKNDVRSEKRS